MARAVQVHLDGGKVAQLQNFVVQPLATAPSSPAQGQFYFDTALGYLRVYDGSDWVNCATATLTADLAAAGFKVTGLGDPSAAQDAATKAYVDSMKTGLDFKDSVRAATTASITLSGAQTIDGVSVIAGDRVLVKDQGTASQNGIYVAAAGAWSRATDFDADAEVTGGAYTWVNEGTTNGDKAFVLSTNDPIVVGTTALTFTQFSGSGTTYTEGTAIDLTGNVISVTTVPVANGGTGGTTAATARENLGGGSSTPVVRRFVGTYGDGSDTSLTVNHALNNADVIAQARNASTNEVLDCGITLTDANNVTLDFLTAPASNSVKCVVIG